MVHASHLDAMVHVDTELPVVRPHELSDVGKRIGKMIATDLVSDGATLQMGQSFYYLKNAVNILLPPVNIDLSVLSSLMEPNYFILL